MIDEAGYVAHVIGLAGGKVVGKTRLQKSVYFLETTNSGFDFYYEYHIFGPYCEDLAEATDLATARNLIAEREIQSGNGGKYSVFQCESIEPSLPLDQKRFEILSCLQKVDAVTLELAATADYLARSGFGAQSWDETAARKASKVTPERVSKAKALLAEIDRFRR